MLRLTEIFTKNFRGILQSAPIQLKRINLLVGKNSGGKSTFARLFPLIRQSVQVRRRSPILWYGELVDFGTFDDVCNRMEPTGPIEFSFGMRNEEVKAGPRYSFVDPFRFKIVDGAVIDASIRLKKGDDGTYLSGVDISIGEQTVRFDSDSHGVVSRISCGRTVWEASDTMKCYVQEGRLLPSPYFLSIKQNDDGTPDASIVDSPFLAGLMRVLRPLLHGNTNGKTIAEVAKQLPLGSLPDLYKALSGILKSKGLTHYLSSFSGSETTLRSISEALLLFRMREFLGAIDSGISEYFSGVRYLKPLRATAQRYYRQQELAIDEVDPTGENIANVLSSLNGHERLQLAEWTERYLHFKVSTVTNGGHVSVFLTPNGHSTSTNLADMGFGFSQILPVLVQLWLSANQAKRRGIRNAGQRTSSIVIEQPELHLHPAFQARLADLLVAATSIKGADSPHLVIETHSSTLVNRFGQLIENGALSMDDIQVLLFESSSCEGGTTIRTTNYDSKGFLQNWPYGFFEPDYE